VGTSRRIALGATIVLATAVLVVAAICIVYLGLAAIVPDRVSLSSQRISELSGVATAAPAAALAVLTIALVVANFRLASGSQMLAELTARQQRDQWEPVVTSRLNQADRHWPHGTRLTNLSTGPAIDCIYVGAFKDAYGLQMWHVTNPIDLLSGQSQPLAMNYAHGFDRLTFEVTDTGEVDPNTGQPLKRTIRRAMRALSSDDFVNRSNPQSRKTTRIGLPTPPVDLFTHQDGSRQELEGREEAVIFSCINGHVHRTLPHLRKAQEQFQPDTPNVAWLGWYLKQARFGIPVPDEANVTRPEPEPQVITKEPA